METTPVVECSVGVPSLAHASGCDFHDAWPIMLMPAGEASYSIGWVSC